VRSASAETLEILDKDLLALALDIAKTRGLSFHSRVVDRTTPAALSDRVIGVLEEECRKLGYPSMRMTSGAGHDAQIVSGLAEVGMIFIPCVDGTSHAPGEMINWGDLEKGANLLLNALIRLAG